jgi:hypothetical protein
MGERRAARPTWSAAGWANGRRERSDRRHASREAERSEASKWANGRRERSDRRHASPEA